MVIDAGFSLVDGAGNVPDYGVRRSHEGLVWHDMEGYLAGALSRWNTGAAGADLCILRDGTVVLVRGRYAGRTLAPFEAVMWHAGTNGDPYGGVYGRDTFWRGHNINPHSHGVEIEGFVATGYTSAQAQSVRRVSLGMHARFGTPIVHAIDAIAGQHLHQEISANRGDPGSLFDWRWALG